MLLLLHSVILDLDDIGKGTKTTCTEPVDPTSNLPHAHKGLSRVTDLITGICVCGFEDR